MRRSIFILFFILATIATQANAENGDQYWMIKAGATWFDKADKPDSLQALNVTYGYGLSKSFAVEVDFQQSAGGGKYSTIENGNAEKGTYSYNMGSIGAAYRYVFYERLYFRGKAAFAYGAEMRTNSLTGTATADVQSLTGSLALGLLAGNIIGSSLTLELEYIKQSDTLSSAMLGANLTF